MRERASLPEIFSSTLVGTLFPLSRKRLFHRKKTIVPRCELNALSKNTGIFQVLTRHGNDPNITEHSLTYGIPLRPKM